MAGVERGLESAELAALLVSSMDAMVAIDESQRILLFNRAAEEMFGYPAEEVLGTRLERLLPVRFRAVHEKHLRDFVAAGAASRRMGDLGEVRGLRSSGEEFPIEASVAQAQSSRGAILSVVLRDTTERERATEAHAALAGILEESTNEIYVFDAVTLRFAMVNRGARNNLGYSLEELRAITPVDIKPEFTREEFEARLVPLRTGEQPKIAFETLQRRKDQSVYPVEVHLQRVRYEGADHFVAIVLDITKRRDAVERERRAEVRADQMEALASISTLTAGIAHDIGAPMTVILGYAEMMRKSVADEKNRKRAGIIVEQVHRISDLVQALLNMARPGERALAPLDLAAVLSDSLEFYREKLEHRGISVAASYVPVPDIAGDSDRLQQAFLSLIINAADVMVEGGVLNVSLTRADEHEVEVRIRDTGTGIPAEALDHVFDPFYTTKKRGRGTGLGLSVAKGIFDAHGGHISVESELGVGTEFAIRLPIVGA